MIGIHRFITIAGLFRPSSNHSSLSLSITMMMKKQEETETTTEKLLNNQYS
jgi:hypothetical protein